MDNGIWILGNGELGEGNGKSGMENQEWGMESQEWGMGYGEWKTVNGELGMGNGEWEIENEKLNFFYINFFKKQKTFFSAAIIDIHVLFFAAFCARIKRYDNGISHPALFIYFTT